MVDKRRLLEDLRLLADLLEMDPANAHRVRAWEAALGTLEALSPLEITRRVGTGTLRELPGIGESIQATVTERVRTGAIAQLEALKAEFPAGTFDLLRVPGLGPKKVQALIASLGIGSVEDLEAACRDGRLSRVKGFGAKSQARLLAAIELSRDWVGRHLLPDGLHLGEAVREALSPSDGRLWVVGSVARRCETVRDVDLLYAGPLEDEPLATLLGFERSERRPDGSLRLAEGGLPVDVFRAVPGREALERVRRTATPAAWQALESRAAAAGVNLESDWPDEAALFGALGLPVVPPELLEDAWGIEAAEGGALLDLVEVHHVNGNLHTHTRWSDGRDSLPDMAAEAAALGHAFLGITDHSRSAWYAGGLRDEALRLQRVELDEVADHLPDVVLFHGIESDILPDGSLDYPDEALAALDYVVASVHSRFDMPREEMTARMLRAIAHPKVAILAHPTGRLLLGRAGYDVDLESVLQACAQHRVAVELNSNPQRLDLDWRWLRRARELGVAVAINSDAHERAGLADLYWGVAVARKAALPRAAVLNAWSPRRVAAFFRKEVEGWKA